LGGGNPEFRQKAEICTPNKRLINPVFSTSRLISSKLQNRAERANSNNTVANRKMMPNRCKLWSRLFYDSLSS